MAATMPAWSVGVSEWIVGDSYRGGRRLASSETLRVARHPHGAVGGAPQSPVNATRPAETYYPERAFVTAGRTKSGITTRPNENVAIMNPGVTRELTSDIG